MHETHYSEAGAYFEIFSLSYWADPDPNKCRCGGTGWALSELDTWHCCPIHGKGMPHPEEFEALDEEDAAPTIRDIPIPTPPCLEMEPDGILF
jgi:hypothetical protein